MTLIADSGSTKTTWRVAERSDQIIPTQGINPFQQNEEEICHILQNELLPALTPITKQLNDIYFYGAGCTPEKTPLVARALHKTISSTTTLHVESDILGAARGLCGHKSGIVAILGTGSNSCYYDGTHTHTGIPALGYILGDEGSGAYIGKRLVGDILKRQLPEDIIQAFFNEIQETQASIIQKVYRAPLPNRFLASLSPFCARHRQHPAIHALILDCFQQFFQRNILHAPWPTSERTIHFVGSIAHYYSQELTTAAEQYGYQVGNIKQSPMEGLTTYHCGHS